MTIEAISEHDQIAETQDWILTQGHGYRGYAELKEEVGEILDMLMLHGKRGKGLHLVAQPLVDFNLHVVLRDQIVTRSVRNGPDRDRISHLCAVPDGVTY